MRFRALIQRLRAGNCPGEMIGGGGGGGIREAIHRKKDLTSWRQMEREALKPEEMWSEGAFEEVRKCVGLSHEGTLMHTSTNIVCAPWERRAWSHTCSMHRAISDQSKHWQNLWGFCSLTLGDKKQRHKHPRGKKSEPVKQPVWFQSLVCFKMVKCCSLTHSSSLWTRRPELNRVQLNSLTLELEWLLCNCQYSAKMLNQFNPNQTRWVTRVLVPLRRAGRRSGT